MSERIPSAGDLRSRVLESVAREPSIARPARQWRQALYLAGGFAIAGLIALLKYAVGPTIGAAHPTWHIVAEGGVPAQPRPVSYVVGLEILWVLVAALATWTGVGRGKSMLGRSLTTKAAVVALTPAALVLTWFGAALVWLGSTDDAPGARLHGACALMTILYAAGPFAAFFLVRGSPEPRGPRLSGAALGAAAGAWAAALHFPYCDCTSPLHILVGHILPVAGLAALGAWVGDLLLAVRIATGR